MSRSFKQVVSILLAAALFIPSAWLVKTERAQAATAGVQEVFRETFASGQGIAVQSGGASLASKTNIAFEGNDDGSALYVANRSNNWDGADFALNKMNMEDGKTYSIAASIYVDAGVTVPSGAQACIEAVAKNSDGTESYTDFACVDMEAGKAHSLTSDYTVGSSSDTKFRLKSNNDGAAVPFYIGDILITAKNVTVTQTVYHEDFVSGKGVATQSGGASLTPATGVVFTGNADGAALQVSNRTNDWDAADFKFSDMGLKDGQTYSVTAAVYVDAGVTVPSGAKACMQTIQSTSSGDSYSAEACADMTAGGALELKGEYTAVDSANTKLRIKSNSDGATVPFYIGDVLITEQVASGGGGSDRDPALPFATVDFEDQTAGGFAGRAGTETLTVTDEANHTDNGHYALKVENTSDTWHGPALRVEKYVDLGSEYKVTAWVKLISPASAQMQLSTQIGDGNGASYPTLATKTLSESDGWVKLEGTYRYTSTGNEFLSIYVQSGSVKNASFYIDDISFVNTSSIPITIQKDLKPMKEAYQNDFLIGNAVSAADLEGVRLDLLKMHHNVATAENAMKPDALQPTKGNFTFDAADAIVNKVQAEGMQMHGHVLVWHQQTPAWMNTATDANGNTVPLSRDEALDNMRTHIRTVMEHFGDKVISWDVVNEAMNDNPSNPADWKASLRQSAWYNAIGSDFVEQAFLAAREVLDAHPDWNIKLYYNDYNEDNQSKAQAIANMVKELNDKYAQTHPGKLLVDGIGMQGHYNVNTKPENVQLSLEKFIALGVEVSISELDVGATTNGQVTEKQANAQGYLYAQLFKIFKAHAAHIQRVTFWGLNDASSWRSENSPLLFDNNLQAKPAYYGVINPDQFIADHPPTSTEANQATAKYGTPAIDGTIDSVWDQASEIPINRYQMAWQGATGTAKALWDDQNLYVLFQVNDAQLDKSSKNAYEQDSVEIFLDQNNEKTTFYQDDDGQYRINFDNETSFNPEGIADGFASATKVSGTNYIMEAKIPLKSITPANDTKLGFDVQINDAKDGVRQSIAAWNDTTGTGYMDTSVYGVLTLAGKSTGSTGGGGSGGGGGGSGTSTGGSHATDGPVTIKPDVKNDNGRVIGTVASDTLKKALEQASSSAGGKKQVVIDVPQQSGATSYEVQLPTASLQSPDVYELVLKTEKATVTLPSSLLSNVTDAGDQVSIRVANAPTDSLNAAVRDGIGSRPAIELSVTAGDRVIAPSVPVTVAIPYTPTAEELSQPDRIVVWSIDGQGNATPIANGRYDAASGTVVFRTAQSGTYAVASVSKTFGDLQGVPWARQAIEAMAARGIILGTSENGFSPAASIKRADFILLLVKALELQGKGGKGDMFGDVPESAYYYEALAIAKELGIATGTGDGTFNPNGTISRQDMMVLAARALSAAGKKVEAGGTLDAFADANAVAAYARDSAALLAKLGVVNGKNGNIAPNDPLTRAEAAVILYRIWKL